MMVLSVTPVKFFAFVFAGKVLLFFEPPNKGIDGYLEEVDLWLFPWAVDYFAGILDNVSTYPVITGSFTYEVSKLFVLSELVAFTTTEPL